jgi:hypothetical protein
MLPRPRTRFGETTSQSPLAAAPSCPPRSISVFVCPRRGHQRGSDDADQEVTDARRSGGPGLCIYGLQGARKQPRRAPRREKRSTHNHPGRRPACERGPQAAEQRERGRLLAGGVRPVRCGRRDVRGKKVAGPRGRASGGGEWADCAVEVGVGQIAPERPRNVIVPFSYSLLCFLVFKF